MEPCYKECYEIQWAFLKDFFFLSVLGPDFYDLSPRKKAFGESSAVLPWSSQSDSTEREPLHRLLKGKPSVPDRYTSGAIITRDQSAN